MTLVNPAFSPVILAPGGSKDSRWLTLEVCREFARSKCSRTDGECKYAHPPPHVEIQNGRVTCCFDSIKGKCQRTDPPCKYLHPPQHLKEILLQNGRQNLIIKNLHLQTTGLQPAAAVVQLPGFYQLMPQGSAKQPYLMPGPLGYTYYRPQSTGNVPTIMHSYRNDGNLPVSMTTNQMVGPLSGTSVATARANGLTPQLVDSTLSINKQLEDYMLYGGSPASSLSWCSQSTLPWEGSSSPSNSVIGFESTSLPFCQPVSYKHQLVEVMTAMSRKRPHEATTSSVTSADDLILGVNAVPVPFLKRPALLDPKSGFPVYQQYAATATYPSVAALSALQLQQTPQIVSLTDTGATQVIPRIN